MEMELAQSGQSKLRMLVSGFEGTGKTLSSLYIARGLVGPEGKICVIDTENKSSLKHASKTRFFVIHLRPPYAPQQYIDAIEAAVNGGADVVILDSISHSWAGEGGLLDMHHETTQATRGKNSFAAWKSVTPVFQSLLRSITDCPVHVIATVRVKTDFVMEKDDRGREVPRKVGLANVQRDGVEHEFDVHLRMMDIQNTCSVEKSRVDGLSQASSLSKPGVGLGKLMAAWLGGEVLLTEQQSKALSFISGSDELTALYHGTDYEIADQVLADMKAAKLGKGHPDPVAALLAFKNSGAFSV